MIGCALRLYMHENQKHGGKLLYEWLVEQAKKNDIHGVSVFRSIAGYGRHGRIHEQHFFELAGGLTVLVEFVVSKEEADKVLHIIEQEEAALFWVRIPVEFGIIKTNKLD